MSKWTKKNEYFATNGKYTMAWNDVKRFTLYYGNEFINHGSREDCLKAFNDHNKGHKNEK